MGDYSGGLQWGLWWGYMVGRPGVGTGVGDWGGKIGVVGLGMRTVDEDWG